MTDTKKPAEKPVNKAEDNRYNPKPKAKVRYSDDKPKRTETISAD